MELNFEPETVMYCYLTKEHIRIFESKITAAPENVKHKLRDLLNNARVCHDPLKIYRDDNSDVGHLARCVEQYYLWAWVTENWNDSEEFYMLDENEWGININAYIVNDIRKQGGTGQLVLGFIDSEQSYYLGKYSEVIKNINSHNDDQIYRVSPNIRYSNKLASVVKKVITRNKFIKHMKPKISADIGSMVWAEAYGDFIGHSGFNPFTNDDKCLNGTYVDGFGRTHKYTKDQLYFIAKNAGYEVDRNMTKLQICEIMKHGI